MFIAAIIVLSLISRVARTTEPRVDSIEFDPVARRFVTDSWTHDGALTLLANRRQAGDAAEYAAKDVVGRGKWLVVIELFGAVSSSDARQHCQ